MGLSFFVLFCCFLEWVCLYFAGASEEVEKQGTLLRMEEEAWKKNGRRGTLGRLKGEMHGRMDS